MENKNKYNNAKSNKSKIQKNKQNQSKSGFRGTQQPRHGVLSLTQLLSRAGKKRANSAYSLLGLGLRETTKSTLNSSGNVNNSELTDAKGNRNFTLRNNASNVSNTRETQNKQAFASSNTLSKGKSVKSFNNNASAYRGVGVWQTTGGNNNEVRSDAQLKNSTYPFVNSIGQGAGSVKRLQNRTTSNVTRDGLRDDQSNQILLKPIIPPKSLIIILKEKPEKILYNRRIIDYKHCGLLQRYIGLGGKILPRRQTRLTAKQQRYIAKTIKTARIMGLLPFVSKEKSYFK